MLTSKRCCHSCGLPERRKRLASSTKYDRPSKPTGSYGQCATPIWRSALRSRTSASATKAVCRDRGLSDGIARHRSDQILAALGQPHHGDRPIAAIDELFFDQPFAPQRDEALADRLDFARPRRIGGEHDESAVFVFA